VADLIDVEVFPPMRCATLTVTGKLKTEQALNITSSPVVVRLDDSGASGFVDELDEILVADSVHEIVIHLLSPVRVSTGGRWVYVIMCTLHYIRAQMTTTLSVRIDSDTKDQLEALAKRARRSKSFLAAEAIAAYVEAEKWQLDEIQAGLQELDKGRAVAHKDVSKWLRSWGKKREQKAPRA
jgi:RHH-type rel operon transcriptional repressor/antitoxin RelB